MRNLSEQFAFDVEAHAAFGSKDCFGAPRASDLCVNQAQTLFDVIGPGIDPVKAGTVVNQGLFHLTDAKLQILDVVFDPLKGAPHDAEVVKNQVVRLVGHELTS